MLLISLTKYSRLERFTKEKHSSILSPTIKKCFLTLTPGRIFSRNLRHFLIICEQLFYFRQFLEVFHRSNKSQICYRLNRQANFWKKNWGPKKIFYVRSNFQTLAHSPLFPIRDEEKNTS